MNSDAVGPIAEAPVTDRKQALQVLLHPPECATERCGAKNTIDDERLSAA